MVCLDFIVQNRELCVSALCCFQDWALVVNSNWFQIIRSYILLLKPPVLLCALGHVKGLLYSVRMIHVSSKRNEDSIYPPSGERLS